MRYVRKDILNQIYKKRNKWIHKGQFGKLVVISGSKRHTGSPCFVGMAAYRAGCDLVYIIAPERAANVAANFSPCLITEPLKGDKLTKKHVKKIISLIKEVRATSIAIGPGLWREKETFKAILDIIKKVNLPMVIDADAIRAISKNKNILKGKRCVLTPHKNEFEEFLGFKIKTFRERIKFVKQEAKKWDCTILLKGHIDIISNGKKLVLNKSGTPFMTKGGCGDTLTGICGAFLARNVDKFTSACAAAYINGKAGELASKKYGEGILPTDLIEFIPKIIKN